MWNTKLEYYLFLIRHPSYLVKLFKAIICLSILPKIMESPSIKSMTTMEYFPKNPKQNCDSKDQTYEFSGEGMHHQNTVS